MAWRGNGGCGLWHVAEEGQGQILWALRSHGRLWSQRYRDYDLVPSVGDEGIFVAPQPWLLSSNQQRELPSWWEVV